MSIVKWQWWERGCIVCTWRVHVIHLMPLNDQQTAICAHFYINRIFFCCLSNSISYSMLNVDDDALMQTIRTIRLSLYASRQSTPIFPHKNKYPSCVNRHMLANYIWDGWAWARTCARCVSVYWKHIDLASINVRKIPKNVQTVTMWQFADLFEKICELLNEVHLYKSNAMHSAHCARIHTKHIIRFNFDVYWFRQFYELRQLMVAAMMMGNKTSRRFDEGGNE